MTYGTQKCIERNIMFRINTLFFRYFCNISSCAPLFSNRLVNIIHMQGTVYINNIDIKVVTLQNTERSK